MRGCDILIMIWYLSWHLLIQFNLFTITRMWYDNQNHNNIYLYMAARHKVKVYFANESSSSVCIQRQEKQAVWLLSKNGVTLIYFQGKSFPSGSFITISLPLAVMSSAVSAFRNTNVGMPLTPNLSDSFSWKGRMFCLNHLPV